MKQLVEFIPLLLFFSVWAMDERIVSLGGLDIGVGGIFNAAGFLLVASVVTYGILLLVQKKLDKFQWITLGGVVFFCSLTIVFQSVTFLKLKAPIVNWIFASIFFASRYLSDKPAIEHMMGHAIDAPKDVWYRLNKLWIIYFITLGVVNLIVAYTLSEATWLQFKVFGNLILTFVFVLGQMPMIAKYAIIEDGEEGEEGESASDSNSEESA